VIVGVVIKWTLARQAEKDTKKTVTEKEIRFGRTVDRS
jgi:hypothetical protein